MTVDPDEHPHSDLVRTWDGTKVLIRHPHGKGPCLFDHMAALTTRRKEHRRAARNLRTEARLKQAEARQQLAQAKHLAYLIAQAGQDLGLTWKQMSEQTGIPVTTLYDAWIGGTPLVSPSP